MQLNYHMYMNQTGYSIAAQEYVLSVAKAAPEIDIRVVYMNAAVLGVSNDRKQIFAALKAKKESEPRVNIYHSIPHRYRRARGADKHFGVCLFETMNPPKKWVEMMNEMNGIITASEFNKRIFESNGVNAPVYVVPHAFDNKMFNKDIKHAGRYDLFTFISLGTWKIRKNWENLIKAFYDGFEQSDEVCLLIKTDKPKELETMIRRIKLTCEWRSKNTSPIYTEQKTTCDFEEIPKIMRKGDVYVSASLGEGFGLPGLHAMALGIPVITTKFGGVLQYAKPNLCTYIEPKHYKTYPVMDGIPQFANCIWPVMRIGEIRDAMRYVFENRRKGIRDKTIAAYNFVHQNFNFDVIGKKFVEAIS